MFEEKEKTTTVAVAKGDLILLLPFRTHNNGLQMNYLKK